MAEKMIFFLKKILDYEIQPVWIFSIFNKWLSEEDCELELMSASEIDSWDDYLVWKEYERKFFQLLIHLNSQFNVQIVDIESFSFDEEDGLSFFKMYREIVDYLNTDKEKVVYLPTLRTFLIFSHDLTIYTYFDHDDKNLSALKQLFLSEGFNLLSNSEFVLNDND